MTTTATWLEVIEPQASAKQVAVWGADSLFLGMRIALDDPFAPRTAFTAGRGPRDDLKCGLSGSTNSVVTLAKESGGWRATAGAQTTLYAGKPLGRQGRILVDGDELEGGAVAFRFHDAACDDVLGVAWRVGDHVMFQSRFFLAKPRFFRGLSLAAPEGPRLVTMLVVDGSVHGPPSRGAVVHTWRNAKLVELDDVDGPTLRTLIDKSKALGGELDGAFLSTICDAVQGVVESLDDVVVRFDGDVVSSSLVARTIGDSGQRLRRMLATLGRPPAPSESRAPRSELAGLVRALFPDEAARHDALVEEVQLLDANAWRERIAESRRSS